jgi:hypothetical protein
MSAVDALRGEVATQHGLDPRAASLLSGETVQELEENATELAHFVHTHARDEEPVVEVDPIGTALAGKAERKRQLAATILRPPLPSRDEQRRFAKSGFDGGARLPVPEPSDPLRDHDEFVGELARVSRTFGVNL